MSIVSAPVLKIYFGRILAAEDTKTENRKPDTENIRLWFDTDALWESRI